MQLAAFQVHLRTSLKTTRSQASPLPAYSCACSTCHVLVLSPLTARVDMTAATWTAAEAIDALEVFDSTLAHPWLHTQHIEPLDASLADLPYNHLLLPSPPQLPLSPLQSGMSHTATRHARHSSLRTPLPAKRPSTAPHSAASSSSVTSTKTAPPALSTSPASKPTRRSIGRATPPNVKPAAPTPSHHRRVSSFSPSTLSPQAADDKQAGRTPRRRATEANHRIPAATPATQPLNTAGREQSDAGSDVLVNSAPPALRRPTWGDGTEEQPPEPISDDDILGKLQQLLVEALVIQQAQGQVQSAMQAQEQPRQLTPLSRQPLNKQLADITNTTAGTQAAHKPDKALSHQKPAPAPVRRDNNLPSVRTVPARSALKKPTTAATGTTTSAVPRSRPSTTKRAILVTQPAPTDDSLPTKQARATVSCPVPTSAAELSAVVRRFLHRVLSLLRVIERLLSRRMAALRAEGMKALKDSLCTSGISSYLERLAATSSSLLQSVHAAINTPIITLHYPEALSAFIPSFLYSSSFSSLPPSTASSSAISIGASLAQSSPSPHTDSQPTTAAAAASSTSSTSHVESAPTTQLPSDACGATSLHPCNEPPVCSAVHQQMAQQPVCFPSSEAELAVLVSTIAQLQSFLAAQQVDSDTSSLSTLNAENRDLRTLIEVQEQQIARQQEMIAQARRQIEWQCQADVSGSDSGSGGASGSMGVSLELSALSEMLGGPNGVSGGSSACGNVSAIMRAEWESGVQEVLSW